MRKHCSRLATVDFDPTNNEVDVRLCQLQANRHRTEAQTEEMRFVKELIPTLRAKAFETRQLRFAITEPPTQTSTDHLIKSISGLGDIRGSLRRVVPREQPIFGPGQGHEDEVGEPSAPPPRPPHTTGPGAFNLCNDFAPIPEGAGASSSAEGGLPPQQTAPHASTVPVDQPPAAAEVGAVTSQ